MRAAGVPVTPGSDGPVSSVEDALAAAEAVGYPVLLKASAGGGGRGIRRCDRPEDLSAAYAEAKAEAKACFGNDEMYLEKLVLISPEGFGRGYATKEDMKPLKMLLSPIAGTQRFLEGTKKKRLRAMLEEMFYEKERLQPAFLDAVCQNARRGEHAQVMYAALKTRFPAAYTKDAFRQLEKPFLLIWGEKNASNPWQYMEEAEKERQKGEFLLFENTAALPHMENTAAFVRLTEEFLEE